jgi:hypothetical protein
MNEDKCLWKVNSKESTRLKRKGKTLVRVGVKSAGEEDPVLSLVVRWCLCTSFEYMRQSPRFKLTEM